MPQTVPQRKQSVFVAPQGLSSIVPPPPPPPPPKKQSLAKPNAQILEQHISKIISENAAIVETLDPLWSKRYHISRNHSTSQLPSLPVNGQSDHCPPADHHNGSQPQHQHHQQQQQQPQQRRYSEAPANHPPLSKLQSALLGKASGPSQTSPPIRKLSELSASETTQQSVIINAKDSNNNNHNSHHNHTNTNHSIASNNLCSAKTSNNSVNSDDQFVNSESIVRNLLTTKAPAIRVTPPPDKTSAALGSHPQNPEGSIIKDLLLKSRDEGQRKKSRSESQVNGPNGLVAAGEQESSMLVYVCTVCNIAFRNKENLEVHQVHYCKGNDELNHHRTSKHKMEDLVQRKVSVMARPGLQTAGKPYSAGRQQPVPQHKLSLPSPPVGNILKQQLLAPNEGPPLKKRKISEPVFRTNTLSSDIQIIGQYFEILFDMHFDRN